MYQDALGIERQQSVASAVVGDDDWVIAVAFAIAAVEPLCSGAFDWVPEQCEKMRSPVRVVPSYCAGYPVYSCSNDSGSVALVEHAYDWEWLESFAVAVVGWDLSYR